MLGFCPSSGFQRYTRNSLTWVACGVRGHLLPSVILEFFGRVNWTMAGSLLFGDQLCLTRIAGSNAILHRACNLVRTGLRLDIGDIVRERVSVNRTVIELHIAFFVHPRQRVLHPVLVVPLGILFARIDRKSTRLNSSHT